MAIEASTLEELTPKDEWILQLEACLEEYEHELRLLQDRNRESECKIQRLESNLSEISSSRAFRLAGSLSRIGRQTAPPGTRRRRVLRFGARAIRAVPNLGNPRWLAETARMVVHDSRARIARTLVVLQITGARLLGLERRNRLLLADPPCFQSLDQVDVSIIIPVFNHWRETLTCLEAITHCSSELAYEVVVIDDCSSDETPEMLRQIEGVVMLRNEQNLGFIGSCNRGAAAARGEYLVFLNNDTVVTPGWLDALAQTFQTMPGVGLAGAKLIYPDGRLQEAGSVIWNDGTGCNYGKDDDEGHPHYNFAREVDYCSGACIMVPRCLFSELGGFDTEFAPAYYEDTDLAFKIRHAGHKVIYQPRSRIIHYEGLTSGRSLQSGVKSFQQVNQAKFQRRWSHRLKFHAPAPPPGADPNDYTRSVEAAARGQILVIDHRAPMPDQDCGSVRMMEIMRAFRRAGQHVTFIPHGLAALPNYTENLQSIGVEMIHQPFYRTVWEFLKARGREFDLVIISRLPIAAEHMTTVRRLAPQAKIVFDTVDLHFLRTERQARIEGAPSLEAAASSRKSQELRLARCADLTLVVSPSEKAILERECPGIDVRILSTIYALEPRAIPPFDDRQDMIFIGGFEHPPNADAVLYFAQEIFPRVCDRLPGVEFHVIGLGATPEILRLASPRIRILGHVPDVRPLFDRARISVAPLRFGAGVKGKVNQSMGCGVPTVVTSVAAEGMHLLHERNAMIADDPEGFANAVVRLYTSRSLWETVSANGLENVREHFSVEAAAKPINDLLLWAGLPVSVTDVRDRRRSPRHGDPVSAGGWHRAESVPV
jgi:GT2 family glycosyltransferase/glycosyltransferase involved in cell wall biosynthesis